ncbi:hypothetical protein QF001_003748 [Paraburkholderia youngii]|uniref:hypothetical protein n=1 Tax=Paraburkholderia youngii TaxID=2782701 RepID=UPI003D22166A
MKRETLKRRLTGDRNQCPSCGEYFNSTSAFDAHRTGPYGTPADPVAHRHCLSIDEMTRKGMSQNKAGFWIEKPMQDSALSAKRK